MKISVHAEAQRRGGKQASYLGNARGMTLLEMVVVIFILSAIALAAVAFTGNSDDQFRYEETRTRLNEIRRAIVGNGDAVYAGSARLSGFVVENGRLPTDVLALHTKPTDYDDFGTQFPLFDPVPDSVTDINDGGEVTLNAANEMLLKGYQPNLHLPAGGTGYYDGWGNRAAPNDGWSVTPVPPVDNFKTTSLGVDGAAGGSDYAQDMPDDVVQDDWTQILDGWAVTLTNRSGTDITFTPPAVLRVSLLVYMNDADAVNAFNWRRITSDPIPIPGGTLSDGASVTVTFPDTTPDTRIPIGEHLLVAVRDPDGASHTADDTLFLSADGTNVTGHALFFPRTTRPVVELIIR
jgi:prepilin-type N-terminal cleavage/methylation domain-containing protein